MKSWGGPFKLYNPEFRMRFEKEEIRIHKTLRETPHIGYLHKISHNFYDENNQTKTLHLEMPFLIPLKLER